MKLSAQFAQVQKGEDRGRGAAFHVARAAPINAAVDNFAWGLKGVIDGFVGSVAWPGYDLF